MKKLSMVLLCALALGLIFENAYARRFNVCNFSLEHENPGGLPESLKAFNDEWTITPAETLDVDVYLNGPSESVPLSGLINEDEGSNNLDLFDVNLKHFSEKMESLGLILKMSKADSVGEERNGYYFTGMNYAIAFPYTF